MRRSDVGVIVSAGLLLLSLLQPAAAQVKQGVLDKDTFMDMESVSSPAISPDGSQIVFSRGWVDKLKDQGRSNIWIVDAAGTRLRSSPAAVGATRPRSGRRTGRGSRFFPTVTAPRRYTSCGWRPANSPS